MGLLDSLKDLDLKYICALLLSGLGTMDKKMRMSVVLEIKIKTQTQKDP